MKLMKISLVFLAASAIFAASAANAQGGGPGWNGGCYGGGPGIPGGYGMGAGMIGGYGAGLGPYNALNLSDEQKSRISQIQEQLRKQHWNLMGQMREESIKLRTMMAQDNPDSAAVGKQQMKVAEIHRQMLESRIDAQNRINALLTLEQRAQVRNYGPGWMTGEE